MSAFLILSHKNINFRFARFVYVNGIIGLVLYSFIHFYLIKMNNVFYRYRIYLFVLFLFLLLNIKGILIFFPILFFYNIEV